MINLNDFKFSKYNHKIKLNGDIYLYNALTGGFGKVEKNNIEYINNCNFNEDTIPNDIYKDEKFISSLIEGGFIVYKDLDEINLINTIHNTSRFGNKSSLGITLLPTTNCNFRCTYCFEKYNNYPNKIMSAKIIDKTLKFIDDNLENNASLTISWFGGEPLLEFGTIKKMQSEINNMASKRNVTVSSGIITNGYLLTEDISNQLVKLGITTAQITLDGSKEFHNKKRKLKNGMGTYDKIISNILKANSNLHIPIRINIDKNNIDNMDMFLDSLKESGICDKKNVFIYFAIVRDYDTSKSCISPNCFNVKEFSNEELKLYRLAYKKGIHNARISINPNIPSCGAVSPNTFVIEPDGTIQKCWNLIGNSSCAIGHLLYEENEYRKYQFLSNQYKWYSWQGYNKDECKNCNILPLCMGGCPYYDIFEKELFVNNNYSCSTLKYNLDETLKSLACEKINK
ncbi:hypothetical protein B2H86_02740 [Clostridium botulinum]|uniref:radical SAM/SPASM domain-containing protein n=1 Tax=Clostridium botulinum TaxID=1491 RepID=UPI000A171F16|nr:SPASM domain-containing protein [Clostridium botulinum]OSA77077.1 hypothetical protein B2H86_02740 [Clostridium botulinum]